MRSFPFTSYDFFGYIASGFVFLFALDHVLGTGWMVRPSWTAVEGLFAVACAYAIGHLLAGMASALIERRMARRWLGAPALHLFGVGAAPTLMRRLYPGYFDALPAETQKRVREKAASAGCAEPGEAMFIVAFNVAKAKKAAYRRMSDFLNNYGLCRNLSFTAALGAVLLAANAMYQSFWIDLWWALAATVLAVGMFFRYLKFYRQYAWEVFTTFANSEPKRQRAKSSAP